MIGAGRLASALIPALHSAGFSIDQVFSRDPAKAEALARQVGAQSTASLDQLSGRATLVFLAVPDDALASVAGAIARRLLHEAPAMDTAPAPIPIPMPAPMLLHSSGAAPSSVLAQGNILYGVFYPVQSFSYGVFPDFSQIPVCLTANTPDGLQRLQALAGALNSPTYLLSDEQRSQLHLAAVMVNNFSNHLFALADQWMDAQHLPFSLLHPLLLETARKACMAHPRAVQTGPALRGDKATIDRHLAALREHPELADLYQRLTDSIQRLGRS